MSKNVYSEGIVSCEVHASHLWANQDQGLALRHTKLASLPFKKQKLQKLYSSD